VRGKSCYGAHASQNSLRIQINAYALPVYFDGLLRSFRKVPLKGTIKAYSACVNAGVISGENGKTYRFDKTDWSHNELPLNNENVTFDGNRRNASSVKAVA